VAPVNVTLSGGHERRSDLRTGLRVVHTAGVPASRAQSDSAVLVRRGHENEQRTNLLPSIDRWGRQYCMPPLIYDRASMIRIRLNSIRSSCLLLEIEEFNSRLVNKRENSYKPLDLLEHEWNHASWLILNKATLHIAVIWWSTSFTRNLIWRPKLRKLRPTPEMLKKQHMYVQRVFTSTSTIGTIFELPLSCFWGQACQWCRSEYATRYRISAI